MASVKSRLQRREIERYILLLDSERVNRIGTIDHVYSIHDYNAVKMMWSVDGKRWNMANETR